MKIKIKYIKHREEVLFTKIDNMLFSEGAIDMIRRA